MHTWNPPTAISVSLPPAMLRWLMLAVPTSKEYVVEEIAQKQIKQILAVSEYEYVGSLLGQSQHLFM